MSMVELYDHLIFLYGPIFLQNVGIQMINEAFPYLFASSLLQKRLYRGPLTSELFHHFQKYVVLFAAPILSSSLLRYLETIYIFGFYSFPPLRALGSRAVTHLQGYLLPFGTDLANCPTQFSVFDLIPCLSLLTPHILWQILLVLMI
jgi:hypothetical protein